MTEEVSEMRSEIRNSPSIIVGREVRGHSAQAAYF